MKRGTDALTVGEAARWLGLSGKAVARLIDSGEIAGWNVPGSSHRRTTVGAVRRFAAKSGVPLSDHPPGRRQQQQRPPGTTVVVAGSFHDDGTPGVIRVERAAFDRIDPAAASSGGTYGGVATYWTFDRPADAYAAVMAAAAKPTGEGP